MIMGIESLEPDSIRIGIKQSLKALNAGEVKTVYVAGNADLSITENIINLSRQMGVPIITVSTKEELGEACHIDVGAAVAVLLK